MKGIWFQLYGAICHTAQETIYLLKINFDRGLISPENDVNQPPRSCVIMFTRIFHKQFNGSKLIPKTSSVKKSKNCAETCSKIC